MGLPTVKCTGHLHCCLRSPLKCRFRDTHSFSTWCASERASGASARGVGWGEEGGGGGDLEESVAALFVLGRGFG